MDRARPEDDTGGDCENTPDLDTSRQAKKGKTGAGGGEGARRHGASHVGEASRAAVDREAWRMGMSGPITHKGRRT